MTAEAWIALVGIGIVVLMAVIASWAALNAKLGRVATKVDFLVDAGKENREAHKEIWGKIDNHETRITRLEPRES